MWSVTMLTPEQTTGLDVTTLYVDEPAVKCTAGVRFYRGFADNNLLMFVMPSRGLIVSGFRFEPQPGDGQEEFTRSAELVEREFIARYGQSECENP